jgi:MFS family permease
MSHRFGRVLRAPFVPWLSAASLLARLPFSVDALAILLYIQERTGSFATAGLVSASSAAVAAVATPVLGRLVDRVGQTRVLVGSAIAHASGLLLLVGLGEAGAPIWSLAACALLSGFYPPLSPCFRNLWGGLLDHDQTAIRTALALDAILLEFVFVGGPLLAAVVFAVWSPAAALILVTILATAGTFAFAAAPPSRRWRGQPHDAGLLGPLRSPGLRTLLLTAVPLGAALGSMDVALPAFGVEHGSRSIGGVAIACLAVGSAVGGVLYGLRVPADVRRSYLWLVGILPFGVALLAVADSTLALLLLAPLAGAVIAPLTAAENELTEAVAPAGTVTEAYSWVITATVGGIAAGAAGAGALVEATSWRTALVVAGGLALAGAVAGISRRATLVPLRPARP